MAATVRVAGNPRWFLPLVREAGTPARSGTLFIVSIQQPRPARPPAFAPCALAEGRLDCTAASYAIAKAATALHAGTAQVPSFALVQLAALQEPQVAPEAQHALDELRQVVRVVQRLREPGTAGCASRGG
jgi:hypothetical protein